MSGVTRSLCLNLTDTEKVMLQALCIDQDATKSAIIRKSLRLYFNLHKRLKAGQGMYF